MKNQCTLNDPNKKMKRFIYGAQGYSSLIKTYLGHTGFSFPNWGHLEHNGFRSLS